MKKNFLRDYQERVVEQVVAAYESGARSILLIAPTGSGKTRMVSAAIAKLNLRCASFAHRREIVKQIGDAMSAAGVAKHYECTTTAAKALKLAAGRDCDALFIDEAHHIAAPSYLALLRAGRGKFVIGATATPYRADGARIDEIFDVVVTTGSARSLSDKGYLANVEYYAASNVDFEGIKRNIKNDFDSDEAFERVRISIQAGDLIRSWSEHAAMAPALIYCINQAHCELVKDELSAAGIKCAVVTSRTKTSERNQSITLFEKKQISALINCEIFTEGTDIKGVHTIVLLRPTLSRSLYKQIIGRGLRPDVDCKVIDHVGNHLRHGDVLNEDELATMRRAGVVKETQGANRAMEVQVGRMAMHIELVEAQMTRVMVPPAFRQGRM